MFNVNITRWLAKLPTGETYDAPVHHVDIYATAAAAAGADLPADRIMDGVDLTPYVTPNVTGIERMHSPHEYLFFRGGATQAVRDERWKLVVSAPPESPRKEWLFDLTVAGDRGSHSDPALRIRAQSQYTFSHPVPGWRLRVSRRSSTPISACQSAG